MCTKAMLVKILSGIETNVSFTTSVNRSLDEMKVQLHCANKLNAGTYIFKIDATFDGTVWEDEYGNCDGSGGLQIHSADLIDIDDHDALEGLITEKTGLIYPIDGDNLNIEFLQAFLHSAAGDICSILSRAVEDFMQFSVYDALTNRRVYHGYK